MRDGKPVEAIADLSGLSSERKVLAAWPRHGDVQPRGYPAAVRVLGQVRGVPGGGPGRAYPARRDRHRRLVIGAFYYLKVVKIMYFDEPARQGAGQERLGASGAAGALCAGDLAAGLPADQALGALGTGRRRGAVPDASFDPDRFRNRLDQRRSCGAACRGRAAARGRLAGCRPPDRRARAARSGLVRRHGQFHGLDRGAPRSRRSAAAARSRWWPGWRWSRQSLRCIPPPHRAMLKWPNDVLIGGAKLAGILLERVGDAVVIGIGVNLAAAPDLPDRATIALSAFGPAPDRDASPPHSRAVSTSSLSAGGSSVSPR